MAAPLQQSKQDFGNSLDLVDIKTIRNSTVVVKDGSLRQILMVGGLNFALKSEMEQNIITQAYQTFLNGIDFPLQIVIHSRKVNIDKYIGTLLARRDAEQTALLQSQIEEYVEFIKGFVQKNAIMEKTFLVVVPFYAASAAITQKAKSGLSFFGKKKDAATAAKGAEDDERTFAENLSQLNQRTSQVMNGILSMGLEATILNDDALVELFYNFYNPQTVEREDVVGPKEQS
jgi:type IV secretory pathway VirB4 component